MGAQKWQNVTRVPFGLLDGITNDPNPSTPWGPWEGHLLIEVNKLYLGHLPWRLNFVMVLILGYHDRDSSLLLSHDEAITSPRSIPRWWSQAVLTSEKIWFVNCFLVATVDREQSSTRSSSFSPTLPTLESRLLFSVSLISLYRIHTWYWKGSSTFLLGRSYSYFS